MNKLTDELSYENPEIVTFTMSNLLFHAQYVEFLQTRESFKELTVTINPPIMFMDNHIDHKVWARLAKMQPVDQNEYIEVIETAMIIIFTRSQTHIDECVTTLQDLILATNDKSHRLRLRNAFYSVIIHLDVFNTKNVLPKIWWETTGITMSFDARKYSFLFRAIKSLALTVNLKKWSIRRFISFAPHDPVEYRQYYQMWCPMDWRDTKTDDTDIVEAILAENCEPLLDFLHIDQIHNFLEIWSNVKDAPYRIHSDGANFMNTLSYKSRRTYNKCSAKIMHKLLASQTLFMNSGYMHDSNRRYHNTLPESLKIFHRVSRINRRAILRTHIPDSTWTARIIEYLEPTDCHNWMLTCNTKYWRYISAEVDFTNPRQILNSMLITWLHQKPWRINNECPGILNIKPTAKNAKMLQDILLHLMQDSQPDYVDTKLFLELSELICELGLWLHSKNTWPPIWRNNIHRMRGKTLLALRLLKN